MLIPHVVQTEADKVFVNIYNSQSSALSAGDNVVWNTAAPDGVTTTQAVTATLSLFMGVADSAISASAYGLAQTYGYCASCLVTDDTSVAVAAGDMLVPVTSVDYLDYSATGTGSAGFVFAAEAIATDSTPAAATKKVFLKCM